VTQEEAGRGVLSVKDPLDGGLLDAVSDKDIAVRSIPCGSRRTPQA
jgi:hypothetical protein